MCGCIGQLQGEELVILREFVMVDADTGMLALEVRKAFPRQEIICFPDPTGSRSQTSSGLVGPCDLVTRFQVK